MPKPITITYTLHPSPSSSSSSSSAGASTTASFPILQHAIEGIRAHLPLRNIHWKSSTRTSLRTIQEVDVSLVDLGEVNSVRDLTGSHSMLEGPLINLCLVVCEDGEIYKTQTRNFIRDWLSLLAARRTPHAPLIVLVNPSQVGGSASGNAGKSVWGKDKGVLGKLKTDFNVGKRDRCVQLNLPPPGAHDPAAWPELINKLKESLVIAFDSAVVEREEEVKRGEAQRLNVGWNFCTWFLLKESLAQSFEAVNLPEDSLIIYEELEASFFQVLKEQNLIWYGEGKLGATRPGDDSLPILDTTAKPYREMLRNSTISIFDFRIYLFARQGSLLGKLGRITEVAKRGQWFVASLTRRLREAEETLAEHFIESWTYTACMDIVAKCDQWSQMDRPNGDYFGLVAYESARSELLDIARIQVERIGVSSGHLPAIYPFNPASSPYPTTSQDILFESSSNGLSDDEELAHSPEHKMEERPVLSNEQFIDAQNDEGNCRALYLSLTRKAIKSYEACGKINSVVRLKADLAALALCNQDWQATYDLSRALARDCAELLIWDPVAKFALESALRSHKELGREKDEDWENLALAYLRVCAVATDKLAPSDQAEQDSGKNDRDVEDVIAGLRESDTEQEVEGHKAFSIELIDADATFKRGSDQTTTQVEVINALTIPIQVDSVSLDLSYVNGEMITFSCETITLQPGSNPVTASCSTSTQGVYSLQSGSIVLGSINFVYNKAQESSTLKVRRDPEGVDVDLRMPYDIKLDEDTKVVVHVRAGELGMRSVRVGLRSLIGEVTYIVPEAISEGRDIGVDQRSALVNIGDLPAGHDVDIHIPYAGVPQTEYAKAQIILQYDTELGTREWIDTQVVFMGLPLTVNVQDFFRPDCLVSHFTIASDGREYLRIGSVRLLPPSEGGFAIEAGRKDWSDAALVTPAQPLSCLFKLRREGKGPDSEAVLRLQIRYKSLEEEIRQSIDRALAACPTESRALISRVTKSWTRDRRNWLKPSILSLPLGEVLRPLLSELEGVEGIVTFLTALDEGKATDTGIWRTLEIPVDVPQHRLLTTVRVTPVTPTGQIGRIYEGRAIPMNVRLSTSFSWAGSASDLDSNANSNQTQGRRLVFDIHNSDDWLICGKKKGYYIADPNTPEEQEITIIPMRPGNLFLPSISVHLLPLPPPSSLANPNGSHSGVGAGAGAGAEVGMPKDELLCETYMDNAAESIMVLPSKKEVDAVVPVPLTIHGMGMGTDGHGHGGWAGYGNGGEVERL